MRLRSLIPLLALAALATPVPASGQEISAEILERFLLAVTAERTELDKVGDRLAELDEKIRKFEECKTAFEIAGEATGSRLGGLAAKAAIRAKCGATSDEGFRKDRAKLLQEPEKVALKAGGFKAAEYGQVRERVTFYLNGMRSGFKPAELDALAARASDLSGALRVAISSAVDGGGAVAVSSRGGRGGRGVRGPDLWTQDYAWEYIGDLFAMTYVSGATMFETEYQPGQWTQWKITQADMPEETQVVERAFLLRNAEGGEWWRLKTITSWKDGEDTAADTVVLEALFKPLGEGMNMRQLVRMRGKVPGDTEAKELMVPQHMAMLSLAAAFPFKPTPESIEGATVGTEEVRTAAGAFTSRHVRFGGGNGGNIEWWLSEGAPGGWVRFRAGGAEPEDTYTMELVGHGSGATSELGVTR